MPPVHCAACAVCACARCSILLPLIFRLKTIKKVKLSILIMCFFAASNVGSSHVIALVIVNLYTNFYLVRCMISNLGSNLDLKITILILIFKITSFRRSDFNLQDHEFW